MVVAAIRANVNIGDGGGICAGAEVVGQSVGATSCSRCSGFLCKKCKKHNEDSIMYLQTLSQTAKRRKKILYQDNKEFGELPVAVGEKLLELKQELRVQYDMHYFSGNDFRAMTSIDIWWEDWYIDDILSLMRERHLRFPEYYDFTDRIMDLNFYTNFKQRYDSITEEATRFGGKKFNQLLNEFVWSDDMIDYVRGI
ncbi:hypothetical protein KY289_001243 [Solanum tuberosum]|nr:hypothetical protein KY289_001243 [Solanum tuberosum]